MNQTKRVLPPFPRIGEIYRVIALALDTKHSNRDLDRLARVGEYNWKILDELENSIFFNPLTGYVKNQQFAEIVTQYIKEIRLIYFDWVDNVEVFGLSRNGMLPLLTEHLFVPLGMRLVVEIRKKYNGPSVVNLLN